MTEQTTRHPLPEWLGADGADVGDDAWAIVLLAYGDPPQIPRTPVVELELNEITAVDVIEDVATRLGIDEADVLRAFAELQTVGAFLLRTPNRKEGSTT